MKPTAARKIVEQLRQDLTHCASLLQNHPDVFTEAIANDKLARREMKSLVSDLFSLTDVIMTDSMSDEEISAFYLERKE